MVGVGKPVVQQQIVEGDVARQGVLDREAGRLPLSQTMISYCSRISDLRAPAESVVQTRTRACVV